jgi:hypothetical protein
MKMSLYRHSKTLIASVILGLLSTQFARPVQADEVPSGLTHVLNFTDLKGNVCELGPAADRTALVLILLNTECPISNSYIPELTKLQEEWSKLDERVDLLSRQKRSREATR